MTIINDSTVVVYDFLELKSALEENNGYTTIYLGSDINLTTGIKIFSGKTNVIIDGTYEGIVHKFEDKKSTSVGDVITASSALIKNVIVKNMNIVSYNYYGVIYVPENSAYKDIVVEYNNITYVGPQISFHPTGLTRFIDSNITIQDNYAAGNEVAECNKIEIGGKTTILHKSSSNSSFWFRNDNPSLTILSGAVVDFTSEKRELFYGITNLKFSVLKNAIFNVVSYRGMSYGTYGTGETVIEQNASFSLKQTNYTGNATWYSYGKITLNNNSTLSIINNYSGLTTSGYNIYFSGSSAGFILNNPYKVVLYNEKGNIIYTSTSIPFEFNFNRINLFSNVISINDKISVDTLPTYAWYKDSEISSIKGVFTNSGVTISSNNYTSEELAKLPDLKNFIFANKRILSVGDFKLQLSALTDESLEMKGITEPDSSILIRYNDVSVVVEADSSGAFSYSYDTVLPIGTDISFVVKKNNDLIYHTKNIQIVYAGELLLDDASKIVSFNFSPIKVDPILCPRSDELVVTVTDSRVISSDWKLYASINNDLTSATGVILKDALVFVDSDGKITTLSSSPTLVYTGKDNEGTTKITNVTWDEDKGILLKVSEALINGMEYDAIITWSLEE